MKVDLIQLANNYLVMLSAFSISNHKHLSQLGVSSDVMRSKFESAHEYASTAARAWVTLASICCLTEFLITENNAFGIIIENALIKIFQIY